jgi:hypothetical protein
MPFNNGFLTQRIGNNTIQFSISAFHAMHCLDTMRRLFEIQFNVASPETIEEVQSNPSDRSFYHIHHCLIYLRNIVTCDADPTLEHDCERSEQLSAKGQKMSVNKDKFCVVLLMAQKEWPQTHSKSLVWPPNFGI